MMLQSGLSDYAWQTNKQLLFSTFKSTVACHKATYKARSIYLIDLILQMWLVKMYILAIRRTSDETKESNDEGISLKTNNTAGVTHGTSGWRLLALSQK